MIEVARMIFAARSHDIDYQLMPWSRSLATVEKGTYDAVVGTDQEESPNLVFPEESFGMFRNGFFAKPGKDWSYAGISSLASVRLGVIDGYSYFEEMDNYIAANKDGNRVFAATGDDALPKLLKMLVAGRIDVVIENVAVVQQTIQNTHFEGEIASAGLPEDSSPLYIAFSPANANSAEYCRIFDEGIVELRNSGKLKEILSYYGLEDWK